MAITRATLLLRSRQWADAVGATLDWPDVMLLDTASFVFVDEWKKLLGAASYYQTQRGTATLDSSGRFTLASLDSGTGDTAHTALRILQLSSTGRGEFQFVPAAKIDLLADQTAYQSLRGWTRVGSEVQVLGAASESTLNVLTNWYPVSPSNLASDTSTVTWPDGYETLLFMETAALMLAKGGRETAEARDLQAQAEVVRAKMHAEFARDTSMPMHFGADDSPSDWGG